MISFFFWSEYDVSIVQQDSFLFLVVKSHDEYS